MRYFLLSIVLLGFAAGCDRRVDADVFSSADRSVVGVSSEGDLAEVDVDNTAVNVRDRDGDAPTPLDQGQGQDDIDTTVNIRKRVVEQPLSINGHNVKIITRDGKVTLRGPVKDQDEKTQIERIASEVAGAGNVTSLLDVERD